MTEKMMKLWTHLILFPAFISAYANPVDCDFEEDSCSWSIEGFRRISDNQLNSTDGRNDIMHRNGSEWYLVFQATNESYATLTSIQTTIEGLQCLNFWYIFRGSKQSHIQVFVHGIGGDNASAIWETSMWNTGWRRATVEIDVQYSSMVIILIRVITAKSYSEIGIDDIVLKLASCLDCNFQDGLCSWEGKEWNVPTKVNYAVTELNSTREDSVLSSAFDIYPGEKCFSFEYQMKDFKREFMFIDVHSLHENVWYLIWESQSQHTLQGWNKISATISVENKSKIAIRFGNRNRSNVTYYIRSISLKKQSCTESTTPFKASTYAVNAMNSSEDTITQKITTKYRITTIVKVGSTNTTTSTAAGTMNTSSYYSNDGVIIGIVIGGLAFTVAVLLIATYLYRRRTASPNANISKHSTVYSVTYSGARRPKTENGETSHLTNNHTTEFRNDTYDCTIMYPTKIHDPTYDHLHFKQNVDTIYDHSKSGALNKDMGYMDHSCDTTLQRSMQDVDPTYDHT